MSDIEVFVQGEGIGEIALVRVSGQGTVGDVVEAAKEHGLREDGGGDPAVMVEDADRIIDPDTPLEAAGIVNRSRVHVHHCRSVAVTVNFEADQKTKSFPPSTTVKKVERWAEGKDGFGLAGADATDHLLQLCGSEVRPDEDAHIGSFVEVPDCSLCFDLIPKERVEG